MERVNYVGSKAVFVDDAVPVCLEAFCDTCGECLACHGEERCQMSENGKHLWLRYLTPQQSFDDVVTELVATQLELAEARKWSAAWKREAKKMAGYHEDADAHSYKTEMENQLVEEEGGYQ